MVRSGDAQRFGLDLKKDGPKIIEDISAAAIARAVLLTGYLRARVRKKPCVVYKSYSTNMALRAIASYLARRFRVVPANRDRIVSGVIEGMADATPFTILRRDITSFYESIDAAALRQRLVYNTSLPRVVRHYLTLYFDEFCYGAQGLPRGIGLTAVLAEMAMEEFDRRVRSLPGVYRYFRYSDDIIIFAFANVANIESELPKLLPPAMAFNAKKSATVDVTKKDSGAEKAFEYLGYRLSTRDGIGGKAPRTVEVTISSAKINRLKPRIILTLKAYRKDKDRDLLIDRLRLLSSNFQINRHGVSAWLRGKRVRSGVYYNYRRCGKYNGVTFAPVVPAALTDLDNFVHGLLKGTKSEFRSALSTHLTPAHWAQLSRISFRLGFASRRLIRMHYARLAVVKGAWRNG